MNKKSIKSVRLKNFRRFEKFEIHFSPSKNILIGDNEVGKSTILSAIELCISASRSKIETEGLENIFNNKCIQTFMANGKKLQDLPILEIEIFFDGIDDEYFNGKNNSEQKILDGLRLRCIPDEGLQKEISDVLSKADNHFPFEFYKYEYETFGGHNYLGTKRPLRHVTIDTSISNNEYAQREYTRSMYDSLIEGHEKATHSFLYRSAKDKFALEALSTLNERTDYKFGLKSNSRSNFESDLTVLDSGIPIEHKGKGQKCFVKANFALSKKKNGHNVVLIEEPENHLRTHLKNSSWLRS